MMIRLSTALTLWLHSSYLVAGFSGQNAVARSSSTTLFAEEVNKQAEYGKAIEFPGTYVKCGKCQAVYAITEEDLGKGRGRRLSCSVCDHSWFQSKDRLMTVNDNFEMVPLPDPDKERISQNIKEGKHPGFVGDAKLYVGNIAFECHENDLMEVFSEFGDVGEISLVRDEEGRNRGFGFITMRTKEDADKAIEKLDGIEIRGRKLTVRESNN